MEKFKETSAILKYKYYPYPDTSYCGGTSLAVASILAITISLLSANFSPNSLYFGSKDLQ